MLITTWNDAINPKDPEEQYVGKGCKCNSCEAEAELVIPGYATGQQLIIICRHCAILLNDKLFQDITSLVKEVTP